MVWMAYLEGTDKYYGPFSSRAQLCAWAIDKADCRWSMMPVNHPEGEPSMLYRIVIK